MMNLVCKSAVALMLIGVSPLGMAQGSECSELVRAAHESTSTYRNVEVLRTRLLNILDEDINTFKEFSTRGSKLDIDANVIELFKGNAQGRAWDDITIWKETKY